MNSFLPPDWSSEGYFLLSLTNLFLEFNLSVLPLAYHLITCHWIFDWSFGFELYVCELSLFFFKNNNIKWGGMGNVHICVSVCLCMCWRGVGVVGGEVCAIANLSASESMREFLYNVS